MKPICVGIDLGTTSAIAILDIEGNLIELKDKRNWKREDIISEILKYGRPILIATDVYPCPKGIEKIAKEVGALIYRPRKSLSVEEKRKLVEKWKDIIKNTHEEDALAAVKKAFNKYEEVFRKAIKLSKDYNLENFVGDVLVGVLKGEISNLKEGFEKIASTKEVFEPKYSELEEQIRKQNKEISNLLKELREKDQEIENLKEEIKFLHKKIKYLKRKKFRLLKVIRHLKKRLREK